MPKTIADYGPKPEYAQGLRDYVTALAERYDGVSDLPSLPTSLEIDRDTDHGGVRPTARGICTAVARKGPRTLVSRAGGGQNIYRTGAAGSLRRPPRPRRVRPEAGTWERARTTECAMPRTFIPHCEEAAP